MTLLFLYDELTLNLINTFDLGNHQRSDEQYKAALESKQVQFMESFDCRLSRWSIHPGHPDHLFDRKARRVTASSAKLWSNTLPNFDARLGFFRGLTARTLMAEIRQMLNLGPDFEIFRQRLNFRHEDIDTELHALGYVLRPSR
jgi:hypothetical protein